ncbi:MAG TPA: hypothetical protein VF198_13330 [Vicinamibacterales bacterium]
MGRLMLGWRSGLAALLAMCLAVPASAGQTPAQSAESDQAETPTPALPFPSSVDRIRDALEREPMRLTAPPIFYIEVQEDAPESIELSNRFDIPWEPRGTSINRWHDEYIAMTTPPEFRQYSPMLTPSERAVIAATSLAFAGAMVLLRNAMEEMAQARRRQREDAARREVDESLRRWKQEQRSDQDGPP